MPRAVATSDVVKVMRQQSQDDWKSGRGKTDSRTAQGTAARQWLVESNTQTRREWVSALDTIESLNPRAVTAGHKRPGNDDSAKIIEETRQCIRDFDRLAGTSKTARELYDKLLELDPERVNPLPLGFRRARPNRNLFRMKGVFLCSNCN
jgi:hypothetical protein